MTWNTEDSLVGERVIIDCGDGEDTLAIVVAISTKTDRIKVKAEDDGEILVGNQWEHA